MDYDEEVELTRYVWRNDTHRMTEFERRVDRAALTREKAAASNSEVMRQKLMKRWGLADDPTVNSALSAGWEPFRRSVCIRILLEHGGAIINRCPRCRRVVKTPRAQQCLWCGHDWHGAAR